MSALLFLLGLLYANAGEWFMHKYILHGLGKKPGSFWAYHLYSHHADSSANGMVDPGYQTIKLNAWNTQTKELVVLAFLVLLHAPLWPLVPAFVAAVYGSLLLYYHKHRKAHLDSVWAKKHLRWHYEHHFGDGGNANWCVTWPWFDYVMGTRITKDKGK